MIRWERLDKLFDLRQGNHLPLEKLCEKGYPVYGANGKIGNYNEFMYEEPTILVTCRGATCGSINLTQPKSWVTGNAIALLPKKTNIDRLYFYYCLKENSFFDVISGSAQPQIIVSTLSSKKVPVPDNIKDQKKISCILQKAESILEKRRQTLRLADEFLKSAFREMFGNLGCNSKRLPVHILKDLILDVQNEDPQRFPNKNYSYIDISSIDNQIKKIIEVKQILGSEAPSRARQLIEPGDVVVSTVRPNLNAVALVPPDLSNPIASTGFCILRTNQTMACPEYIFEITKSSFFISSLVKIAKGASYPAVTDRDILAIRIPVPSLTEQQKFIDLVQKVERLKEKQKQSEQKLTSLFNALMQRAFQQVRCE